MKNMLHAPNRLRRYASGLAVSALALAVLAATLATGPAQAQNPPGTNAIPGPCGPGAGTAFMEEPHEVTSGHYALFDGYWEQTFEGSNENPEREGVLHTNACPPEVVTTTVRDRHGNETIVTSLAAPQKQIDISEAIFHI